MRTIEHAVDVWDLAGLDRRLNAGKLLEHLRQFASEGWELVWIGVDVELEDHRGPCHVLVFKRVVEDTD
jgi:hypothetical protein